MSSKVEDFVKAYCAESAIDESEFYKYFVPLPDVTSPSGWAAISNNPASIKAHVTFYCGAPVVERQEPVLFVAVESIEDLECVGMHATRKANDLQHVPLYASTPAPVAAALLDLSVIREYHYDAAIRLDRYAADADMRKSDSEHYRKRAVFHRDQVATIDKIKG